ncbi:DEAD/DEAH box helicase [Rhodococcus hoagii]|nr:DEAD/DEAH box helicase [Prescottella equi]
MSSPWPAVSEPDDAPPPFATIETPLTQVLPLDTAVALGKAFKYATVGDLLAHYPKKHRERGELATLTELVDGEPATVCVRVASHTTRQMRSRGGKSMLVVRCVDITGAPLEVAFFSLFPHKKDLPVGATVMISGKAHWNTKARSPIWTLRGPEYSVVPSTTLTDPMADATFAGAVIPIYPAKGVMSSLQLEDAIRAVLDVCLPLAGPVDEQLAELGQLPFDAAIRAVHCPESKEHAAAGFEALRWSEAIVAQVALAVRRSGAQQQPTRPRPGAVGGVADSFDARLPFPLTDDQATVGEQIATDLDANSPMHSLVQGEVGAGKTLVALRAMLRVVDSGGQAAMLAPTEVLATQHYKDLIDKLGDLADPLASPDQHVKIVLYTGSMKSAQAKQQLAQIASDADIIVGTHALLAKKVRYRDLGLVVVDEQHRFGIEQRAKLRAVGTWPPHLLMMSATPIPGRWR